MEEFILQTGVKIKMKNQTVQNKHNVIQALSYSILCAVYFLLYIEAYSQENHIIESVTCLLLSFLFGKVVLKWQDVSDSTSWEASLRAHLRGGLFKRDACIRISFAYLFRIIVDGKYFLVKSKRKTGLFQPVGGAYKCNVSEKHYLARELDVYDDNNIPIDVTSENDYRMQVPAKNLKKFMKRFNKTKDRECLDNLSREFNEEVNKPLGLEFETIQYTYVGRDITKVQFSKYFQCYEILLADIIRLDLSPHQIARFRKLMNENSEYYYFASDEEIKHCGVTPSTEELKSTISNHSFNILESYAQNLSIKKRQKRQYVASLNS